MAKGTLSAALGTHASPWMVEHAGKVYKARAITQKVKSAFERWLARRVADTFLPEPGEEGSKDYDRAVEILSDRIALGRYAFHGEISRKTMTTPEGALKLACLIFDIGEDEMIALVKAKKAEVNLIVELVIRESFPEANLKELEEPEPQAAEGQVPNVPGPASA